MTNAFNDKLTFTRQCNSKCHFDNLYNFKKPSSDKYKTSHIGTSDYAGNIWKFIRKITINQTVAPPHMGEEKRAPPIFSF